MPQPGLRLSTVTALVFGLLAVGLAADNLAWLAGLRTVIQRSPSRFPSSLAVPPAELTRPGALLSVYTEAQYLYAPDHGLLTNPTRVGRDWEHPATVSYFEDGDLRFAANAGLRVHGGTSRTGSPVPSFRLYFRTEYGSAQFRGGTLFAGKGDPLTRLVVHNDLRRDYRGRWWHLVNPLAYDVARRIGALAPETHPASFILNGDPQGLYVLTEHVRKPFLVSRFGHDNFDRADEALRRQWMRDVMSRPSFTMADAATWLDVESLTRWFISIVFCGTSDPFQAVMFRNRTQPGARWFWVNWDMDHSFMDFYRRALAPWTQDSFAATIRPGAFEARVIRRLLNDDPVYRDYLATAFLDALNYRITPAFLNERWRYYRAVAERFGLANDHYLEILSEFLGWRPTYVRGMLVRHLNLNPLQRVQLAGPPGTLFRINDRPVSPGFSGWYIQGTEVVVELAQASDRFLHWSVGNRRVPSREIRQRVEGDMVIRAEFRSAA